MVLKFY